MCKITDSSNNWKSILDINNYKNRPINYLEIGVYYGNNLISVIKTYAKHKDSIIYCIDNWCVSETNEYNNNYRNFIENPFNVFMKNMIYYNITRNLIILRGEDYSQITNLNDNFFDIIYINRNCPKTILEDAVLSFPKLNKNGIMIFNNYGWCGSACVKKGINEFLDVYYDKINILLLDIQVFIQKL